MEIKQVIKQICAEKNLSEESVMETIDSAMAAAYRKDFGDKMQNVQAEFNIETGEIKVFDVKEVVEDLTPEELEALEKIKQEREELKERIARGEVSTEELRQMKEERDAQRELEEESDDESRKFNPKTEIQLCDAKKINKKYKIGDIVKTALEIPGDFGRMAAQTAKQVIVQKLREAERNLVYQDYKDKEGQIINAMVQKFEGNNVLVDLDNKTTAILPANEQIRTERFKVGDRVKVYISTVALTTRGPEIIVSRTHPEIVKTLFTLEIPEIANDVIQIKAIAREAGARTKIAVATEDESLDPIGSCIGQRGARIQTIIHELNGEKIDIIEYSEEPEKFINNALLPAKIIKVEVNEQDKTALVIVPEDQLSLAIGRAGQNVRLASKLTGWTISVREQGTEKEIKLDEMAEEADEVVENKESEEKPKKEKAKKKVKKADKEKTNEIDSEEPEVKEKKVKKTKKK